MTAPDPLTPHQRSLFADEALRGVILGYLAEHPAAMDSIEGIAEWWITRQQIRVDVERLASVLERLVAAGVLDAVDEGEARMYRLGRAEAFPWRVTPLPAIEAVPPGDDPMGGLAR
ncbi:MAG TPA: hypothetical protein VGD77_17520 [Gemmatimonadaceae bacterium]